jgi:hypothetical protein
MSNRQIDVTIGQELKNWRFLWILHPNLEKSLMLQRFSLNHQVLF